MDSIIACLTTCRAILCLRSTVFGNSLLHQEYFEDPKFAALFFFPLYWPLGKYVIRKIGFLILKFLNIRRSINSNFTTHFTILLFGVFGMQTLIRRQLIPIIHISTAGSIICNWSGIGSFSFLQAFLKPTQ